MGKGLKYLLLLVVGIMAYKVFERLQGQYRSPVDATELTGAECTEVELYATVEPTRLGKDWDRDSAPDIAFQVGSQWTAVCHDTLHCQQSLVLPAPATRFELQVWDRDEKDKISGEEAQKELIGGGWLTIDRPEGVLGVARVQAKCID